LAALFSPFQGIEEAAIELADQVKTSVAEASKKKEDMLRKLTVEVEGRKGEIRQQLQHFVTMIEEDRDRIIEAARARSQHHIDTLMKMAKEKEEALTD